jgi:hypothetical protein
MPEKQTKLVLAFGHKAQNGKDSCVSFIKNERGAQYKIQQINFADALRKEVTDFVDSYVLGDGEQPPVDRQLGYMELCKQWGVQYDANAPVDTIYPDGKQRALLQAIGNGKRVPNENYWVDQWQAAVDASDADVVLVSDMRYVNEFAKIKTIGGVTIRVVRHNFISTLTPEQMQHISENALNHHIFDALIEVGEGQLELLRKKALALFDFLIANPKERGYRLGSS